MTSPNGQPVAQATPWLAWCVEHLDPRRVDEGSHQLGAFTTEDEALRLLDRLRGSSPDGCLRVNHIHVYRRVEDWESHTLASE